MSKWIDLVKNQLCPGHAFENTEYEHLFPPIRDIRTEIRSSDQFEVIGCRGVTCEECWNQEAGEE